jgi:uroporphyrinogen decarboxylase
MEMTPRERWLALLSGKRPDRIPADYQATPEVTARLLQDCGCPDEESLYRRLHIDARRFFEPARRPPPASELQADIWGIRYRAVSYASGAYLEPVFSPLASAESVEQIHAHPWPACDEFDYEAVTRALAQDDGYRPRHAGCYEPFLLYGYLRGLQKALEDLILRPEIADAVLGHLFDFHYEHLQHTFEAGRGCLDTTWVAEDLGSQTGPLISLALYRRFLLPNQIKMADLARSYGVHVMYHTDGAARIFIPDLLDRVGIEILDPVQWRCPGMEREKLVEDFGPRIVFHGSIDNQQTLAFGTPDDVVREVRESVKIYASARWICGPCHNLQPVTSTRNIEALYETIYDWGAIPPS